MTIELEQLYWEWERRQANQTSNLVKVARAFVENCDRSLSVREIGDLTSIQSGLQTIRYNLVRNHGFQFKVSIDTHYEYKLMHINLSHKPAEVGGASKDTETFLFPNIAPLWRLALGLDTAEEECSKE